MVNLKKNCEASINGFGNMTQYQNRVARLQKIQYGKVMESYGNLKKIWKSYGISKK